jgi:hypothetical protein
MALAVGNDKETIAFTMASSLTRLYWGKFYPGVLDDRNIRQDLIYQSPLKAGYFAIPDSLSLFPV